MSNQIDENTLKLIARLRALAASTGWSMKSRDETGIEFYRPKRYSFSTLLLGGILLIIGVGLLVLIWGCCEYLAKDDEIIFVCIDDILDRKVDTDKFN